MLSNANCFSDGNSNHTTVILVGSDQYQKKISNKILDNPDGFITTLGKCEQRQNELFTVITTPDMYDEETPNQNVIDCITLCHPGPHVFLLVVQGREVTEQRITEGRRKIQEMYGEEIARNTAVLMPHQHYQEVKQMSLSSIYSENDLEFLKGKWSYNNSKPLKCIFDFENVFKKRVGQTRRKANM